MLICVLRIVTLLHVYQNIGFRLYTSVQFANFLLDNQMTVTGTVNIIRKGIPPEMKQVQGRPEGDYRVLYEVGGKLSLHSWLSKTKKGRFLKHKNSVWFMKNLLACSTNS